jgi:hypothetical protein
MKRSYGAAEMARLHLAFVKLGAECEGTPRHCWA